MEIYSLQIMEIIGLGLSMLPVPFQQFMGMVVAVQELPVMEEMLKIQLYVPLL